MSHASGQVKFKDGTIMHFEYDGTSDVVIPKMYSTYEEMWENWRNHDYKEMYKCQHEEEDVEITHTYGYGTTMSGRACRKCNCITFDYESYLERQNYNYGWGYEVEEEEKEEGWVKRGLADWYEKIK